MRTFENIAPLRKSQPDTMTGFGQLAKSAMAEGADSAALHPC